MKHSALILGCLLLTWPAAGWAADGDDVHQADGGDPKVRQLVNLMSRNLNITLADSDSIDVESVRSIFRTLDAAAVDAADLDPAARKAYWLTLSRAAAVSGDVPRAWGAARKCVEIDPNDPVTLQNLLFTCMLAGNRSGANEAMGRFDDPHFTRYAPWVAYMKGLLPLVGTAPSMRPLPLSDGSVADLSAWKARVVVLDFWTVRPDSSGRSTRPGAPEPGPVALARQETIARRASVPLIVVGVNLDHTAAAPRAKAAVAGRSGYRKGAVPQYYLADHPEVSPVPKPFALTAVPTACVIGADGRVMYVGDSRGWQLRAAVQCAQAGFARQSAPASTQQAQSPDSPAAEPSKPVGDEELAARELYERGRDTMILGKKSRNRTFLDEGVAIMRECMAKYPDTEYGRKAAEDVRHYGD